jgi:hypothetical protein
MLASHAHVSDEVLAHLAAEVVVVRCLVTQLARSRLPPSGSGALAHDMNGAMRSQLTGEYK